MTTAATTFRARTIIVTPSRAYRSRDTNALLRKTLVRMIKISLLFMIMFATMNSIFGTIDQQVCSQPGAMQNVALHCEEVVQK